MPLVVLVVLGALLLIGPVMMGMMMGPGAMMGPGMMWGPGPQSSQPNMPGWMWGLGMGFGWLAMLAFWGILIVGIVLVIRWVATPHAGAESAGEILKQRYARGEIDSATFQRMLKEVE
jgi:putative membrane protein